MPRIAVTGASGLIGSALVEHLRARGDSVVAFVRGTPTGPDQRPWQPRPGGLAAAYLDDVDAVVHLAGAGVGDRRWTPASKETILRSRVEGTTAVAEAVAAHAEAGHQVRLVSGSAVGYYGDRGDELLDERSAPGDGFLAEVVRAWEGAAAPAVESGAPVAFARTGLVMARDGGAFSRIMALARLGLAGPLGSGQQWWPWITLADEVRALALLVDRRDLTGPVNLVAPQPAQQREVAAAIATQLSRPALLPAPSLALRLAVGEFADDILASQRVVPAALRAAGFDSVHPTLESAATWLTARD
ncbi:MAG TPA: TIGR01777 family oxidoreductase [Dermatophilaceae bacterium]|nr:TIGR01777 family oxidoreductase [Dermatophilaceae bacterium]